MPPVIKKPCVNNNEFSFSGKECSPLGKGYASDAEQVGTIMEGRDSTMWMVGIKNGVKVWNRVPTDLANDSLETATDLAVESIPIPKKTLVTKKKAAATKKAGKKKVSEVSESEDDVDTIAAAVEKEDDDAPLLPLSPIREKVVKEKKEKVLKEKKEKNEKAPPKKKNVEEKVEVVANDEDDTGVDLVATKVAAAATPEKKGRKPTDFNYFMSYKIKLIGEENPQLTHKEKFSKVASLWKELNDDEKKAILIKAKAAAAVK